MKPICPECGGDIAADDVNIAKAVMFCRHCNELFPIDGEELDTGLSVPPDFEITDVPDGVELLEEADGVTVKVKNLNWFAVFFALIFGVMFGGGGVMMLFKAVTGGVATSDSGDTMEGISLALFSLPFLLVGIGAWCVVLFTLLGHTSVLISETVCRAFVGIGSFGWKKDFYANDITGVELDCCGKTNNKPVHRLMLEKDNGSQIKFGTFIPEKKVAYVCYAVKTLLNQVGK